MCHTVTVDACASGDVRATDVLRLGAGEADLGVDADFSKLGRVDACLERRLELLDRVHRLARSLARWGGGAAASAGATEAAASAAVPLPRVPPGRLGYLNQATARRASACRAGRRRRRHVRVG